jgi:hypothetical protein
MPGPVVFAQAVAEAAVCRLLLPLAQRRSNRKPATNRKSAAQGQL